MRTILFLSLLFAISLWAQDVREISAIGEGEDFSEEAARIKALQHAQQNAWRKILLAFDEEKRRIYELGREELLENFENFVLKAKIVREHSEPSWEDQERQHVKLLMNYLIDVGRLAKWLERISTKKLVAHNEYPSVIIEIKDNLAQLPKNSVSPENFYANIRQTFLNDSFDVRGLQTNLQREVEIASEELEDVHSVLGTGRKQGREANFFVMFNFEVSIRRKPLYGTSKVVFIAHCIAQGSCNEMETHANYANVSGSCDSSSFNMQEAIRRVTRDAAQKAAGGLVNKIKKRWADHLKEGQPVDVKIDNISHGEAKILQNALAEEFSDKIQMVIERSFARRQITLSIRTSFKGSSLLQKIIEVAKARLAMTFEIVDSQDNYIWLRVR